MSSIEEKEQLLVLGLGLDGEFSSKNGLSRNKYPDISIEDLPLSAKSLNKIDFKRYSALIFHLKGDWKKEFRILADIRKRENNLPFIFFSESETEEIRKDLSKLEPIHFVHIKTETEFRNSDIVSKTVKEVISNIGKEISGKAAPESLSESSVDRYRKLLEHLPVGVYRTTPEGRIVEANRNLASIFGFNDAKELLNTDVNDLYLIKTDRQEHLNRLDNTPTLFAEHELRRKNGEFIWVRDFPRAVKDINGKIIYYDGILLEITDRRLAEERLANYNEELEAKIRRRTREQLEANERLRLEVEERKRIEAALRESEERFKGITERSFDAILEVDWEARIKYASPSFTRIFGYDVEEVFGKQIFFLFSEPESPKLQQGMKLIRNGRNIRGLQMKAVKKDGSQAEIEFNISPIFQDGKIVGANGNLRDISERKKAERALIRQIDELSVLHDVSKVCVEANDPDELIEKVTKIIGKALYSTNFELLFCKQDEGILVMHASYHSWQGQEALRLKIGDGITGRVAMTGKPIRTGNVMEEPLYIQGDERTRSELCVPLKVRDRILGVINTESDRLNAFSSDDERLLMTFAGQLAPALERLRADQSLVRQLQELTVLHAVAIACVDATDPIELMSRVKNIIVETIDPSNFSIWLTNEKEDSIIANSYYQNDEEQKVTSLKINEGIIGRTVKLGLPHRVDDVSKFEGYVVGDERTRSELCVPLKIGTKVIGAINTEHEKLAAFSEDDERLLVTLAGQLAPSIERLRAEQSLIRQLKELKVLHAISTACVEATNPEELMNRVARIVVDTIYTTNFGILLLDEKKGILTTHASYYYFEGQSEFEVKLGEGIIGKVARTCLPVNADDVSKFPEYLMGDPHSRSELCVPLKVGNRVIGVINVESEQLSAFSEEDERLLGTIAFQLGLALDGLYKEGQLKEDKELFHNYLDIAGVILIAMDENLNIRLINRKGSQILAMEPHDLIGKNWIDACVPERVKDAERSIFNTLLNTSDITYHPVEGYVLTGKGSERMIAWNRSVLKDDKGNITGILSSGEDITIRKELEERLRKSEEEYRTLVQNIRIGVYRSTPDIEGKILKANPAAADILGFSSSEELIKRRMMDFHLDIQNRKYVLDEIKKTGYVKDLEVQIRKNDGSLIWCSFSANGLFNDNGNLVWIDSVLENITEKKESRDALLAEKERLAVTLRAIGDGVISVDVEGRVILMNNVASKLTGWNENEAFSEFITDVVEMQDPSNNEKYIFPLDMILTEGSILDADRNFNLIAKSGHIRVVSCSGAPIRDRDSKTIGAVMVFRDVTEKTKLEEELLKAQKIESIGFLAGGIAHDFNNILAAILGNISLARINIDKQGKSSKYLSESEKAISRATNLTNQLLTFSKGGDPVKKVVSVRKLLIESVNFSLAGSNIEAQFHIPKNLWNAKVDKDQINQVLSNVVLNSVQVMPAGGTIEIYARNIISSEAKLASLPKGEYILMKIKDSGSGISEENIAKIFDPYFTTKKNGTGLGLAISYSIIKKHDGFIRAESKLGQGTTFYIYLPAFKGKAGAENLKYINVENGSGRILYMDDDNTISETIKDLLSHIGYSVDTVNEGSKAIDLYKKAMDSAKRFDLVILDLTVPGGMGGKDTLDKLLEIDDDIVAIATSGYSNDPVMSDFKSYGFTDTIAKPFRIQEIADVVKRCLAKKSRPESKSAS
jgi:two-component system cell cycle sensor histidine kinase/response regulator CckA